MATVQTKEDISKILLYRRRELERFGVKRLGLFGSFLRGSQDRESDVDLLVEFIQGKKSFKNFMRLVFFLEDLFQRKVELVTPESLSPYLKPTILKEVDYVLH